MTLWIEHRHDLPDHFLRAWEICRSFEQTQRVMWSAFWPMGHCAVSSLLLAPILRAALEREYRVVIGYVNETHSHREGAHAWVQDEDENIFDITYGQFAKEGHNHPTALGVMPSGSLNGIYMPFISLALDGEEEMRRQIKPQSQLGGWSARSDSKFWFALAREIYSRPMLSEIGRY